MDGFWVSSRLMYSDIVCSDSGLSDKVEKEASNEEGVDSSRFGGDFGVKETEDDFKVLSNEEVSGFSELADGIDVGSM